MCDLRLTLLYSFEFSINAVLDNKRLRISKEEEHGTKKNGISNR
jgi:hypothetical protein